MQTKDDVPQKWYNILSKHKPRIADKFASAKRTGGGPADAQLDELELKISSIKGRECLRAVGVRMDYEMDMEWPTKIHNPYGLKIHMD